MSSSITFKLKKLRGHALRLICGMAPVGCFLRHNRVINITLLQDLVSPFTLRAIDCGFFLVCSNLRLSKASSELVGCTGVRQLFPIAFSSC